MTPGLRNIFAYVTADYVGMRTGGGKVTQEEVNALFELGVNPMVYARDGGNYLKITADWKNDPWAADDWMVDSSAMCRFAQCVRFAQFYSGTFSRTIERLKQNHVRVAYTAAAHHIETSRAEHDKAGLSFAYPHLTDKTLWERYVKGYQLADVVICPSEHSKQCMEQYGCKNIKIVPHGVDEPAKPLVPVRTDKFVVGYLGAVGPDKGLRVLFEAWSKLNYKTEEAILIVAGAQSTSHFVQNLLAQNVEGRLNLAIEADDANHLTQMKKLGAKRTDETCAIALIGWVNDTTDFYDSLSLYVQPSITEGFGIEVLEAMIRDRAVVCSTGAGAVDCVAKDWRATAGDANVLAAKIDYAKRNFAETRQNAAMNHQEAMARYLWSNVRKQYHAVWRTLL